MANVLFVVDNNAPSIDAVEHAIEMAKITGSGFVALGVIPVHLYNQWEPELEKVGKDTKKSLKAVAERAKESGIEVTTIIRSGYPDEEILRVADEYSALMMIIPDGGNKPSELTKAANIILDEPETLKSRLLLVPSAGAA